MASVHSPLGLVALPAGERRRLVLAIALSAAAMAAAIGLLATSGYLISRAAQRPQILQLMVVIVAVRALGLARAVLRYAERLTAHDLALRQLARMRTRFFAHLAPLVPGQLRRQSGDLLARFVADVDTLSDFYLRALIPTAVAALVIAGASIAAWAILPAAGAAVLLALMLAAIAIPWLSALLGSRSDRRQGALRARMLGELVESIDGAEELVMCGRAEARIASLDELDRELCTLARRDALVAGLATTLGGALTGAGLLAVLVLGVAAVHSGALAGVLLAALAFLFLAAYEAIAPLPAAARSRRTCAHAGARLQEIEHSEPAVLDPRAPTRPDASGELRAEHVSFRYESDASLTLEDVSIRLARGESLALLGSSGAGKSTLAELLVRFADPTAGRISLDGVDVRKMTQEQLRSAVLLCGQEAHLFNTTIRENLLIARRDATDAELRDVLEIVELRDWAASLPDDLNTLVGSDGDLFSGGQRQRLALARALLSDARFLILDEPTAHLDGALAGRIATRMLQAADRRGLLLITHDRSLAQRCDRTLELGSIPQRSDRADLIPVTV